LPAAAFASNRRRRAAGGPIEAGIARRRGIRP
jgi:hypothetical protein